MRTVNITNTKNISCAKNEAMSKPYFNPTQELMTTSLTIIATVNAKPSIGLTNKKMAASGSINVKAVQKRQTNNGNPP